jgi:hypothetical protein
MANFAEIDGNNIVLRIIAINDSDCLGGQYPDSEESGTLFINETLNINGYWKQTSFSGSFRYNHAQPGMYFDSEQDAFYWNTNPNTSSLPELFFDDDNMKWYWETQTIIDNFDSISCVRNYW